MVLSSKEPGLETTLKDHDEIFFNKEKQNKKKDWVKEEKFQKAFVVFSSFYLFHTKTRLTKQIIFYKKIWHS